MRRKIIIKAYAIARKSSLRRQNRQSQIKLKFMNYLLAGRDIVDWSPSIDG